jgi:hypothetical protein
VQATPASKTSLVLVRSSRNGKAAGPDTAKIQGYLDAIEGLIREAKNTSDPRVLMTALRVLGSQADNVSRLGVCA